MRSDLKLLALGLLSVAACGKSSSVASAPSPAPAPVAARPATDPRVGLKAGMFDAGEATSNMRVLSKVPSPEGFNGITNSDISFTGQYAVQGNYNGFQIWDMANPAAPVIVSAVTCPASQNDISVYKQELLFMSAEAPNARLDCGKQGFTPADSVSPDRIRGVRIFDIRDIRNPKYITSVQTCRGSHTHTLVEDPKDKANLYIYVSGSSGVRSPREMPGCVREMPDKDPNSSLFKIEIIRVPLANPAAAAIVSRSPFLMGLNPITSHGEAPDDKALRLANVARAKAAGGFIVTRGGLEQVLPPFQVTAMLDSVMKARGGTGLPSGVDSAALRAALPGMVAAQVAAQAAAPRTGPNQCHDITVYPELGIAGGACGGYGVLLDIKDPTNPIRIAAVADSNFAYWHSATFNNDGTKLLFSDEWGGGGSPKCRASDPKEWGADAIFSIENNNKMSFKSYYKLSAPQTALENCVAHNGSLIPIPDRDVMVQAWYQGGISVFDWTDAANPKEIAFFDRGPSDSTRQGPGGSWSVYWYNGHMISSEIARGLDIMELTPSEHISQNELLAANTVRFDYFNAQGQPKLVWPPSFALACSYLDQLQRSNGLAAGRISSARAALARAEAASGDARRTALTALAGELNTDAATATDAAKVRKLAGAVSDLVNAQNPVGCSRSIS
ncbi:MAG: hypothetical protein EXR93_01145 [Gemmatimonadetes bacterium]|nr:hypothetical protein [Gemmatimonadota bacterium]